MNQDIQSLLMQAFLAPDTGSNREAVMQEVLSQMGDVDPQIKLLASYLAQYSAEDSSSEIDPEVSQEDVELYEEEARVQRSRTERRLRQKLKDMYQELQELRERNDMLAEALGACYLCWGDDPICKVCRGRGRPGCFEPDRELCIQFISPAARRLRKQERNPQNVPQNKPVPTTTSAKR